MRLFTIPVALAAAAVFVTAAVAAVPSNTSAPTVAGRAHQGDTLTASPGSWAGNPTSFAYQWQRCASDGSGCGDVSGATAKAYAPVAADVDHALRVVVTASNADGQATASSRVTPAVASSGAPVSTSPPTISGTAKVGEELAADPGTWTGGPRRFTYQWQRCSSTGGGCADVGGAVGSTYGVRSADSGQTLRVAVTAHNGSGSSATATSDTTDVVGSAAPAPAVNRAPTLSILSIRRVGVRIYARFRVCDDRGGRITVVERDTRTHVLSYTRKYTVYVATCGAFSRSWTPAARFRIHHGKLVVRLQPIDKSRAQGRPAARSLSF
ncbi:MAG TPA: hypothetical protein VFA88_09420 [Gaiellaceae bacterium]|jgi:hypothetical protein|nr:hypothetical protein [Gaiellaceae bacterium]